MPKTIQLSNKIFCDDFLQTAVIENKYLPNPYNDYPFLIIENFFARGLLQSTPLQVLVYREGDFYIKHADDSSEIVDKQGETVGFNCIAPTRKLSTILFGTSHASHKISDNEETFEGGELVFNYLFNAQGKPLILYPKAGDIIVFFSNPFFSHEVNPVSSGYRLSMVQWHNAL